VCGGVYPWFSDVLLFFRAFVSSLVCVMLYRCVLLAFVSFSVFFFDSCILLSHLCFVFGVVCVLGRVVVSLSVCHVSVVFVL
jgi:hypothetical protein